MARACLLASLIVLLSAGPSYAVVRWAAPGATGPNPCLEDDPCNVEPAIEGAAANDEVILKPGAHSTANSIDATVSGLYIHGQDGQLRPVVSGATSGWILDLGSANGLRHVELVQKASTEAALTIRDGATVSDVILVGGEGGRGFSALGDAVLRDSVVRTAGAGEAAIQLSPLEPASTLRLRNVTAITSGMGSAGVEARSLMFMPNCSTGCAATIDAKNVIARGENDLDANTTNVGVAATINVDHSNYRPGTVNPQVNGSGAFVNDLGSNQSADPLFANAAAGDFHQLAASPTIDAGTSDPFNGATDFDGQSRLVGAAPDIGADEFFVAAPAAPVVLDVFDPVARLLRLRPSTLAASGRGPSLLAARRPTRTRVSYRLSEPARMRFTVERARRGRRVGRRCVAPNRRNRGRRRCTRYVRLRGSFTHQGAAGANRFRFTGRLRNRKLRPGRYRLVGVPTDAAGNRGRAVRARFRIVRR